MGFNLFILVNLALGFLISTLARSQMQAMQLSFFTILPSILLSGFMFPFAGMPDWAQLLGTGVPATHFLRLVRAVAESLPRAVDEEHFAFYGRRIQGKTTQLERYKRVIDALGSDLGRQQDIIGTIPELC